MAKKDSMDALYGVRAFTPTGPGMPSIEPGPLKRFTFTLPENWTELLRKYFKMNGMDLSTGMRTLMIERITREMLK